MADIKTRDAIKDTIKTIDKAAVASERMKAVYAKTKDKAEQGYYAEENSTTEYAANKISHTADRKKDEGIHQFNKQGQKSVDRQGSGKGFSQSRTAGGTGGESDRPRRKGEGQSHPCGN